jgi:hypothetical protein
MAHGLGVGDGAVKGPNMARGVNSLFKNLQSTRAID